MKSHGDESESANTIFITFILTSVDLTSEIRSARNEDYWIDSDSSNESLGSPLWTNSTAPSRQGKLAARCCK